MKRFFVAAFILIAINSVTLAQAELPKDIQRDILVEKITQGIKSENWDAVLASLQKLKKLGGNLPASIKYFEGKALLETGDSLAALDSIEQYISKEGKKGKYYKQAIQLLIAAENAEGKRLEETKIDAILGNWEGSLRFSDITYTFELKIKKKVGSGRYTGVIEVDADPHVKEFGGARQPTLFQPASFGGSGNNTSRLEKSRGEQFAICFKRQTRLSQSADIKYINGKYEVFATRITRVLCGSSSRYVLDKFRLGLSGPDTLEGTLLRPDGRDFKAITFKRT